MFSAVTHWKMLLTPWKLVSGSYIILEFELNWALNLQNIRFHGPFNSHIWKGQSGSAICGSRTYTEVTACDYMTNLQTTRPLRTFPTRVLYTDTDTFLTSRRKHVAFFIPLNQRLSLDQFKIVFLLAWPLQGLAVVVGFLP